MASWQEEVRQTIQALDHGLVNPTDPTVQKKLLEWLEREDVVRAFPVLLSWAKYVYPSPIDVCRLALKYRDLPLDWTTFCPESCFECVQMALAELGGAYPESTLEKSPALTDPMLEPFWRDLAAFPGRWATLPWRLRDWAPTFARPSRNVTGRFIELRNGEARVVPEDSPPGPRPPDDVPGFRFDGKRTYVAIPDDEETTRGQFSTLLRALQTYAPILDLPLRSVAARPRLLDHIINRLRHSNIVLTPATIVGKNIRVFRIDDVTLRELDGEWYTTRDRLYISNSPEPYRLDTARASLQPTVPVSIMVCRLLEGSRAVKTYRVEAVVTEGTRQINATTAEARALALAEVDQPLVSKTFYV